MSAILYAVMTLSVLGLIFGLMLGYASKIFAVKTDDRLEKITAVLPGANCGGCGFAGCNAFAAAIIEKKAEVSSCAVCTSDAVSEISKIMGIETAPSFTRYTARVLCSGKGETAAKLKFDYDGVNDCYSAMRISGGLKFCKYGCMGLGTCIKACKFGAIYIEDAVAKVDKEKCTACGACVKACPKKIIELVPYDKNIFVACSSKDKALKTREVCLAGCIGCGLCEKSCDFLAVSIKDNLAKIAYDRCTQCQKCVDKCPKKIIKIESLA